MKRLFKKMIPIMALLMLCTTVLTCMGGCASKKNNRIYETEFFRCINYEWEDFVTILELTPLGKKQEVLVIPEIVNGKKVGRIGGYLLDERKNKIGMMTGYELESENVKKIYFKYTPDIEICFSHFYNCAELSVVILASKQNLDKATNIVSKRFAFYSNIESDVEEHNGRIINKCNVYFYLNDNKEDQLYWIDIMDDNDLYFPPEQPIREGYVFDGWYTEKECINEWVGEYVLPEGQEALNLYANWTEV